jgi:hypothetical protein
MEHAKNVDVSIRFHEVGYPIMLVQKNSNFALGFRLVAAAEEGMILQ